MDATELDDGLRAGGDFVRSAEAERPLPGIVQQIAWVYVAPGKLFANLTEQPQLWPVLGILVLASSLLTWARIATGVGAYEVDLWTEHQIARTAEREHGTMPQGQLDDQLRSLDRGRDFWKFLAALEDWGKGPLRLVLATIILSTLLYALVSLVGERANTAVIYAIVLFAMYVEIPRMALEVVLIQITGTTRVDLSAAAFIHNTSVDVLIYALLRQLDPFQIWFWILVGLGLDKTRQAQGKTAALVVIPLALVVALWNVGWDLPRLIDMFSFLYG